MEIKEDEIKEINTIGSLHDSDVKLVTLKGGFHIGMGKKEKNSKKNDILAVGSHPALVSHQISKKYDQKFEQTLSKNEHEPTPVVKDLSHNLSSAQKNVLGLDIFAIEKNEAIEFKITKHNFEAFSIEASKCGDEIVLNKTEKNENRLKNINKKELSKNLEKTIFDYAKENNLKVKKNF